MHLERHRADRLAIRRLPVDVGEEERRRSGGKSMTVPWKVPPSRPSTSSLKSVRLPLDGIHAERPRHGDRARDLPPALEIRVGEERLHHPRGRRLDQLRARDVEDLCVDAACVSCRRDILPELSRTACSRVPTPALILRPFCRHRWPIAAPATRRGYRSAPCRARTRRAACARRSRSDRRP